MGGKRLLIRSLYAGYGALRGIVGNVTERTKPIMNTQEAMQHGLGYAAGREDASGIKTISPTDAPGFIAFAEAYADGWGDFNAERRHYMTNTKVAYDTWQATDGRTIFPNIMKAFDPGPRNSH